MLDQFTDSFLFCDEDVNDWMDDDDDADTTVSVTPSFSSSSTLFTIDFQNTEDEVGNMARLLESESDHVPDAIYINKYQDRSVIISGREVSVAWIMKVHAHHKFKPVTALLAVNYFDRFLSAHQHPQEDKGWSFQLLAVSCITLAAKMEEKNTPSLLDIQLFESEPRFAFDSKEVRRMELLVMGNLNWRLHSITPLHYVEQFIATLASSRNCSSSADTRDSFCDNILSIASGFILRTVYVIELVGVVPSAIAASAVILAAGENARVPESLYNGLNKDSVASCLQAMKINLSNAGQLSHSKSQLSCSTPPCSPAGILDVVNLRSSSTQNSEASDEHASQPAFKRLRSSNPDEE